MKHNMNLFASTRKQLTHYNSGMLIIFLLLFNIVISLVLFLITYHEQRMELFDIGKQEINELNMDIDEYPGGQNQENPLVPSINKTKGIFLTYFLKPNHRLIIIDEYSSKIREPIFKNVKNWKPDKMGFKFLRIELSEKDSHYLFLVSQNIYQNGKRKGTIYIGKDITYLITMYFHFLFILLGISLIFFVIALLVGHTMTKQAIKPIIKAYTLQSEFIANVSHELRTPLSVLQSGLEAIDFEEGKHFSPIAKNILSDLQEEVRSTTQLVNHLLYLIRSDSGEQPTKKENFDLLILLQQIIRSFQRLSESKDIKLDLLTLHPLPIYTDKENIKQLLYILIDNALKYTPNGGNVCISYEQKDEILTIVVQDNGIGISSEQQQHIFDRFYRADKSRSRQTGSSGLGLSIGKSIIESLHGTIKVSSKLNAGSKFFIMIPLPNR
ncbi:cell wall metabolism sensor histidine kinase WalK [Shimazuella sp. AN120528]|uniref:sensor histidine kinase n=1 Tax=Shimazuella soli TaxID=1892854 RepID=UPI001F0EC2B6|nr:ATP-binding protein [Shimazuella soli]MCH5583945.1 cell wall metabolism sensor histidine kinase WalK [Shimazuella soli]